MNIAITGATGLIGRRLVEVLLSRGHSVHVLSRHSLPDRLRVRSFVWDPETGSAPGEALRGMDAVIHLAGESVAQRWTAAVKHRIRDSRVLGTRRIVEALAGVEPRPGMLIAASAVGYYGSRGGEILDESARAGSGYLAEVCAAWEREAAAAEKLGIRVSRVRIGMVLDPSGGALGRMLPAFRLGLGGRLGSGTQWLSWVHIADLAELFCHLLENPLVGASNGVAPQPVTNREFTRELGRVLRRPAVLAVPEAALRLLFGEMSEVLLSSQRAVPRAAQSAGFRFQFPELAPALEDLLAKSESLSPAPPHPGDRFPRSR